MRLCLLLFLLVLWEPTQQIKLRDLNDALENLSINRLFSFHDLMFFHTRCKNYNSAFRVDMSEGKGLGAFANRRIRMGERIWQERPLFIYNDTFINDHGDQANEMFDRVYLSQMHELDREEFMSMANSRPERPPFVAIVETNAFYIEPGKAGIIPKLSRINHSCRPSTNYAWSQSERTMNVYALRDIPPNEEIFVTYIDSFSSKANRQKTIEDSFRFKCSCEMCSANKTEREQYFSDMNLEFIKANLNVYLADRTAESRTLRRLYEISREEGLEEDALLVGRIHARFLKYLMQYDRNNTAIPDVRRVALANLTVSFGNEMAHQLLSSSLEKPYV